jgi:hypothetical protein
MTTPAAIITAVAAHYGITVRDVRGSCRVPYLARARAVGMYLTRELTSLSYPRIGAFYGGKDHSTVIWAINKIRTALARGGEDDRLPADVATIRALIPESRVAGEVVHLQAMRDGLLRKAAEIDRQIQELRDAERAGPAGTTPALAKTEAA